MSKPLQKQSRIERKNVCTVSRISLACCICNYAILTQATSYRYIANQEDMR